jgi:parallel beta-helix repeat protein
MKKSYALIFIFLTSCFALPSFSQTIITVQDTIWADEVWSADTVKVDTDIVVMEGATLTIDPGTYVKFQGLYALAIFGSLKAVGTPTDSIVFSIHDTSLFSNPDTSKGGWRGMYLQTSDTSILRYCKINHTKRVDALGHHYANYFSVYHTAYTILEISCCHFSQNNKRVIAGGTDSQLTVDSCLFEENTDICISAGPGKSIISNCILRKNIGSNVINAYNGELRGNFIYDNQGTGIYVSSAIRVEIINNLIANNGNGGIRLNESDPVLANNTICNNNAFYGGGIKVSQTSSPLLISNIIWNNQADLAGDQIYIESFSKTDIRNSILEGGLDSIGYGMGSSYKGEYISNIEKDPAFINAPAGIGDGYASQIADWVLSDTSPCINKGLVTEGYSLPVTDILGTTRISHGFIDIGALEFHKESITAGGIIDSSVYWIADTVKVIDNVEITADNILSIAPGTIVEFQGPFYMECASAIRALGKATDSIFFTAKDSATGWKGIRYTIIGEGNDTSVFRYVSVSHMLDEFGPGLLFRNAPYVEISNSVFKNNFVNYVLNFQTTKADINLCSFINNRGSNFKVIYVSFADLSINHCLFYKNIALEVGGGIIAHSRGNLDINNSYLINNDLLGTGMLIYKSSGNELSISNSVFANNNCSRAITASNITSSIKILSSTFTRNIRDNESYNYDGGHIYVDGNNEDSKFIMTNSILHGNPVGTDSIADVITIGDINSEILNNNIQGGRDSIRIRNLNYSFTYLDNLDTLPGFLNPTYGAGPEFDALNADWGLSIFSPCLDKGISDYNDLPLADYDILGNPRLVGNEVDLGAVENQSQALAISTHPDNLFLCEGDTALFTVEANDSALYQWIKDGIPIENADSAILVIDSIQYSDQGNYKCIITNGFGSVSSNSAYLLVKLPPKILSELRDLWATPDEALQLKPAFSGSEPMSYTWKKDGLPIPGESYPELYFSPSDSSDEGMYSFELSNSCGTASTVPVSIYLAPQLCMVTVSEATGDNLVVWEKKTKAPIMAYNVYRISESAGIYDLLATTPFDDLSVLLDSVADPTAQAYLYKVTAIDTGNIETDIDLCKPHKTIHLLVSTNPELLTTQLEWDNYYGFNYDQYNIYRSTTGTSFSEIHSLSSDFHSWTDSEILSGDLFYRIAVQRPDPCYPSSAGKAGAGPYHHALSNLDNNRLQAGHLPPDTLLLDNNSIYEENSPGAYVGRFSTVDPDTVDSHTYHLIPGEGDDDNFSFTLAGDLLLAAATFDYETKIDYSIRVRTTDLVGNYFENIFPIQILDVNEATGLPENIVGTVKALPNPFSHLTTITFPNPQGKNFRMKIMDLSGKVVMARENITSSDFVLKANQFEKGLYLIEITGDKVYRGKLVVE